MEWVATGRAVPGATRRSPGGSSRAWCRTTQLLPAARALAREIADNTSGVSVCLARQLLWKMLGADHPMEAHKLDSRLIHAMGASPDAYEGVQSFLEKRPARFTMKVSSDLPERVSVVARSGSSSREGEEGMDLSLRT